MSDKLQTNLEIVDEKEENCYLIDHIIHLAGCVDDNMLKKLYELYNDVDSKLMNMERVMKNTGYNLNIYDIPVSIKINSPGGDLPIGLAIYDFLKYKISRKLICIVEGECSSAATIILAAGKERLMSPNSTLLIHPMTIGLRAKYPAFKRSVGYLENLYEKIKKIYLESSTLTESQVEEYVSNETYLTAEQALRDNLITKIIGK